MRAWALAALLPWHLSVLAEEESPAGSGSIWVNPGAYSHHFDRDKPLRDHNSGFGVEFVRAGGDAWLAGSFNNSNSRRSRYVGYAWRPLQSASGALSAGLAAGAFDGYPRYRDGGWFLALMPVLTLQSAFVGLNVFAIPRISDRTDAAIAFQLRLKLW